MAGGGAPGRHPAGPGGAGPDPAAARWWTTAPRVRVRRLRLRLELDLRDNLQRTLYATGTYEPALLRFLADDPADAGVRSLHGTGTQVQEVEVATFDTWAAEHRVERLDLVKLDVEGAELAALQGMAGALARLRPRVLVVEVKDRVGVDGDEVRRLLGRLGYEPTGQVLAVANEVYRPAATTRPPAASTR